MIPSHRTTVVNWQSPDGKQVQCFTRTPFAADSPQTFFHLAQTHQHLVCEVCGKVSDIPARELDDLVARLHDHYGFELEPSRFALLGQCSEHGADSALAVGAQGAPPDGAVGLESVG